MNAAVRAMPRDAARIDMSQGDDARRGASARKQFDRRKRLPLSTVVAVVLIDMAMAGNAEATTYRCEADGHVTYSNQPCEAGTSTVIGKGPVGPGADDRKDALDRARNDQAKLDAIERERRQDERAAAAAAAAAARRGIDPSRHKRACDKLAKAARKAHDDFELAGPRDQPKTRLRMQRADEDYAALCKTKR